MKYQDFWTEENQGVEERFDLISFRIREIGADAAVREPYRDFFQKTASFMVQIYEVLEKTQKDEIRGMSLEALEELNRSLYEDITGSAYERSYGNPAWAVSCLGETFGPLLSFLYTEIRGMIVYAFENRLVDITILSEVFVEVYNLFESETDENALHHGVQEALYYFLSDNSDITIEERIIEQLVPEKNFAVDLIKSCDLSDMRYLYFYGEYISQTERDTAKFLNSLDEDTIVSMAETYIGGYLRGFALAGKDISIKKTAEIRYSIGFERVMREAVRLLEKQGLGATALRPAVSLMNKRQNLRIGYTGTPANPQYDYDHRYDLGLFLDKALKERKLSVYKTSMEHHREAARGMAGPAVLETFGEKLFEPVNKPEVRALSKKQQAMASDMYRELAQITNEYIPGDERSFTIISYPIPEIGPDFEDIFRETIRINNLDNEMYKEIQERLIEALDGCEYVVVKGKNGNETDLRISLHPLEDPKRMTNFENCLADVNIPLGEVFTSPVLAKTRGVLHVKEVYIHELRYENLRFEIEDGKTVLGTCTNFANQKENEDFIKETILFGHESLPMGEFAIGTNTAAYRMARDYNIFDKLKILIAEKTGPHFAFGDTCYSHSEDMPVYNPDGREVIARDNEVSIQRKTDITKAYFGCHTDVTLPYEELGELYGVTKEGDKVILFADGRFVLPGCEELNKSL